MPNAPPTWAAEPITKRLTHQPHIKPPMDLLEVSVADGRIRPERVLDLALGQQAARVAHEQDEELEDLGRQGERALSAQEPPLADLQPERPEFEAGLGHLGAGILTAI